MAAETGRQIAGQEPSAFILFAFIELVIIGLFVAIALDCWNERKK